MTKKDYELIASCLKGAKGNIIECLHSLDIKDIDGSIADLLYQNVHGNFKQALASKNPRFNKEKFLQACGVKV